MLFTMKRCIAIILLITSTGVFAECVFVDEDPFNQVNRATFYFNHMIFALYIKPAAAVLDKMPLPAKESLNNFIQNIRTVPYAINGFLQGKIEQGANGTLRFALNTTLGIAGLFDVAAEMGVPEKICTLGDTFYAWGWKESSYCVVPLVGPSTVRDAIGLAGDYFMAPSAYFPPDIWNPYYILVLVNTNYQAKQVQDLVSIAGVNDYDFVRSSYLQHRRYELTGEIAPLRDAQDHVLQGPPE